MFVKKLYFLGSSRQAILKYIKANYSVGDNVDSCVKMTIRRNANAGKLVRTSGKGASGSFKLKEQKKAAKKPVAKSVKKSTKSPAKKKASKKSTVVVKEASKTVPKKKPAPKKEGNSKEEVYSEKEINSEKEDNEERLKERKKVILNNFLFNVFYI